LTGAGGERFFLLAAVTRPPKAKSALAEAMQSAATRAARAVARARMIFCEVVLARGKRAGVE